MGFNRIMNTILKFRRLAAKEDLKKWLSDNSEKYQNLMTRKEQFEKLTNDELRFIEQFQEKYEDYYADPGNFIDDATKPEFIRQENGVYDYNFRNTKGKSLFDYDQVAQRLNDPMDDVLREVIINPLFPYVLRKRVERNTFNDQDCKKEMDRIQKILRDTKEFYNRYKDEITGVESIIQHHNRVAHNRNNIKTAIDHINMKLKSITEEITQLNNDNKELNTQLDTLHIDEESGEEYTYRGQYELFRDDAALFNLYEVGNSFEEYTKKLNELKEAEQELNDALQGLVDARKNQTGDYDALVKQKERLTIQVGRLNKKALVAHAIIKNEPKYRGKDEYDGDTYDYIEAAYANEQLKKYTSQPGCGPVEDLLPHVIIDDKGHCINVAWSDIKNQMPDIINIKERVDTVSTNESRIRTLMDSRTKFLQDLDACQQKYDKYTKTLDSGENKYQEALQHSENQDYKDHKQEVTAYVDQQAYLKRLERVYNRLAKGPHNNKAIPDENKEIKKLQDAISADEDYITVNRAAYDKAKSINEGTRSYKDNRFITLYDEAVKRHNNNRQKLYDLQRTNSEKLQAADASRIDYKKIADKIIKQLVSEQSLLGILLTQSIDKFVSYYLMNNNFQAPNLSPKMRLLHYYMSNEPADNVRLKDLADFQDSSKNMDLLKSICELLMKESKNNIMDKFLSILKSDFKEVYNDYNLNIINSTDLFYVDEETQGKQIRKGPYTVTELKQILGFDKNPSIGDTTVIPFEGRQVTVKIIEDNLTGDQIYELLNNENQKDIQILFEKVKKEIIEYIREELQYKSYEICKNPGNNFYGAVLAQSVQEVVSDNINYDQLADWLTSTKKGKTQEFNKRYYNQTVNQFRDEIIEQLCQEFNTDNQYVMFVKFLQSQGVHNDNMIRANREPNVDYYSRLEKIYAEPYKIFMLSLERIIKHRISLCKKELQIRDKNQYAYLTTQDRSEEEQKIYNRLNGYVNEAGEQVPGLLTQVSTKNRDLKNMQQTLYTALITKVKTTKSLNNIDESFIKGFFNSTIIALLHGNDDINQYILKFDIADSTTSKGRNKQKLEADAASVKILQLLESDDLISNQVKEYKEAYKSYLATLKDCKNNQRYLEIETTNNDVKAKGNNRVQNSLIPELLKLYAKLYGSFNPLSAALAKIKLDEKAKKSDKDLILLNDKKTTDRLNTINENIKYIDENIFIDKLNNESGSWQRAGLYGKLVNCDKTIRKTQQTLTDIIAEFDKLSAELAKGGNVDEISNTAKKQFTKYQHYEEVLKQKQQERDTIYNNITTCKQRIQLLEETSQSILTQDQQLLINDELDEAKDAVNADKSMDQLKLYTILSDFSIAKDVENQNDKSKSNQYYDDIYREIEESKQEAVREFKDALLQSEVQDTHNSTKKSEYNKDIDESRHISDEYNKASGYNPDDEKQEAYDRMSYDELMCYYWDNINNSKKMEELSSIVDPEEANMWMQEYLDDPNSINNTRYVPSKEAIMEYKRRQ